MNPSNPKQPQVAQLCTIYQHEQLIAALPTQGDTVTFTYTPRRGLAQPFTFVDFGGDCVLAEEAYRKEYTCRLSRADLLAALQQLGMEQPITFTRDNGLVLSNGVTTIRVAAAQDAPVPPPAPRPVIKPLSFQRQPPTPAPQPQAQTSDALTVLRGLLERSRRQFGAPQVYAEIDGGVNVWLDVSLSVSVKVTDTATTLTAHRYDAITLQQIGTGDARTFPPMSGAQTMQLFALSL